MLSGPLPEGAWWKQDGEQREVELHCKCNRSLSQSSTELWSCLMGLTLQNSPRLGQPGWIINRPPSIHQLMNMSYGWARGSDVGEALFSSWEQVWERDQLRSAAASTCASWESEHVRPGGSLGHAPGQPPAPLVPLFAYWYQCPPFSHAVLASLFLSWDIIYVKQ